MHRKQIIPHRSSVITRMPQNGFLNPEVVINNLIEASKLKNTRFLMSAATAWLKVNMGKNLYDMEIKMRELGLRAHIIADKNYTPDEFDLCVPGNPDIELKYVAVFVNFPNEMSEFDNESYREKYLALLASYGATEEENLDNLKWTGFSCAKSCRIYVANVTFPTLEQQKDFGLIDQLRWGLIRIKVDTIDLGEKLEKEVRDAELKYSVEPSRHKILYDQTTNVSMYSYVIDGQRISDIGEIEYTETNEDGEQVEILIPVHIQTYITNLTKKQTTNPGPPVSVDALLC